MGVGGTVVVQVGASSNPYGAGLMRLADSARLRLRLGIGVLLIVSLVDENVLVSCCCLCSCSKLF